MVIGAHFTPSLLDPETLERLFVNRHHHLDDALARIERAATSDERAAKLFVGPRGAGKTHLISLVYHRARASPGFGTRFQLAWLPEDMWTISSLEDLATEIVAALEPAPEAHDGAPIDVLVDAARRRGPIVVLVENLDVVLEGIGGDGQRKLRALLENDRPLLLIATATRLGQELLDQAEPFYGFFDTTTLEPFGVDEAAAMLRRIAEANGDRTLATRLDEPQARNRLATVAHLAGGQPRVWALLGSGLTVDGLDELVTTLVERFDHLTPYYQQQLDRLSLNERRAVRALASADGALSVADLADRTGIDQRSLGKTITDLRRRGWVLRRAGILTDLADQRRSYYQLAEPLARLAFQLKEARGRPVALVVEFLKAWFDDPLGAGAETGRLVTAYRDAAHQSMLTDAPTAVAKALSGRLDAGRGWASDPTAGLFHPDPNAPVNRLAGPVLLALDDAVAAFEAGDPEPLLHQPPAISQLLERQLATAVPARARLALARLGLEGVDAERWVPRLEDLCARPGDVAVEAAALLALHDVDCAAHGPADVLLDGIAVSASPEYVDVLVWLGEKLLERRRPEQARAVLEAARPHTPARDQTHLAVALEASLQRSGRAREVVPLWEATHALVEDALGADDSRTLAARNNLALAYASAGDLDRAIPMYEATLADSERVLGPDHPGTLTGRNNLALAYESAGDLARAIPMYEATLADSERALGSDHPKMLASRNNLACAYSSAGDVDRAIPMLETTLADRERVLGPDHPDTLVTLHSLAYSYDTAGNLDRAIPMYESVLADRERVLGPDHPDTLASRNNLAYAYEAAGDLDRAIPLFEATLADCERVLGPDHPNTLASRSNLAFAYEAAGDLDRAIPLFEASLAGRERVLGSDHPTTRASRDELAAARERLRLEGSPQE